ncbi:hypothetical protein ILYODFUR_034151 [Ilyodon furcidens]|uniref:Uncharacterized protein n=1 Tax=Ilyodon furcidens TaxID=33524 RepID=A0ABV0UDR2_9TELE
MQMCTFVYWNSNPKGYVNPNSNNIPQGRRQHISLIRDKSTQRADTTRYNPLELMSLEETHWDCFEFSLWINLNLLMKF